MTTSIGTTSLDFAALLAKHGKRTKPQVTVSSSPDTNGWVVGPDGTRAILAGDTDWAKQKRLDHSVGSPNPQPNGPSVIGRTFVQGKKNGRPKGGKK